MESLKDEHAKALGKSGVKPFVLYSARHTCLTRLAESGADEFQIMKIAGHADIRMAAKYVHTTTARKQAAFVKLENYNAEQMRKVEEERRAEQVQ